MSRAERDLLVRWLHREKRKGAVKREFVLAPPSEKFSTGKIGVMVKRVFAKRMDAVIVADDGEVTLVEIKRKLDMKQLGQLICGKELIERHYPSWRIRELAAVCGETDKDLESIFKSHGIKVYVVS